MTNDDLWTFIYSFITMIMYLFVFVQVANWYGIGGL